MRISRTIVLWVGKNILVPEAKVEALRRQDTWPVVWVGEESSPLSMWDEKK
jgi:hypothetical protein